MSCCRTVRRSRASRENLKVALQDAGYTVRNADEAGPPALVIDVHIKEFWSWFQPGFWSVTLNANILTNLDLSGAAGAATIKVQAENSMQIATESAWVEITDKALKEFRRQATEKAAGFH